MVRLNEVWRLAVVKLQSGHSYKESIHPLQIGALVLLFSEASSWVVNDIKSKRMVMFMVGCGITSPPKTDKTFLEDFLSTGDDFILMYVQML